VLFAFVHHIPFLNVLFPDNYDEGQNEDAQKILLGEDEVYAWNELRLHPLLISSIRRLGFKEPTPIQKACIPAAAHQGKVCSSLNYWHIN
jgi:superfamily II DNA/RNA helicase